MNNPKIHIGCNYHLTWQSHKAMRFVLESVEGEIATLKTRVTKKEIKTHVSNLIFIESEHNINKSKNINIMFWVFTPFWAETEKACNILVRCNEENNSSSESVWFPKKFCSFEPIENQNKSIVTCPKWFYDKNNLKDKIKKEQYVL